jgi:hypothetical protein
MDFKGMYQTLAIGGFKGKFIFIDRYCGYMVVFLVKSKTQAFECTRKIVLLCRRFGHRMRELRVDMGTVENSSEFMRQCHEVNTDIGGPGVEVLSANIEMQQQNPVERHIQTADNMEAAIQVGQDLLVHASGDWQY